MKNNNQTKEIILVDKSEGLSSYDVIRVMKKRLGTSKIGHAGTLDPLATGLLILGVGEGTKRLSDLIGLDKVYEFEVILGEKRDTGDLEGNIIEEDNVEKIKAEKVRQVLKNLQGRIEMRVPRYSAVKVDGEALYKKARRGENFVPPKRKMEIKNMELLDSWSERNRFVLKLKALVGSGTYIRSLAEKVGERLDCPAVVRDLRRTRIGNYKVENSDLTI